MENFDVVAGTAAATLIVLLLVAAIRNAWNVALWIARNERVPPPS